MENLSLGEFREFTNDLSDDYEIRIDSVIEGEQSYHTSVYNITSRVDIEGKFVVLEPSEIEVSDGEMDLENFADYLIENASESFEHQDRELLLKILEKYLNL